MHRVPHQSDGFYFHQTYSQCLKNLATWTFDSLAAFNLALARETLSRVQTKKGSLMN